VRHGCSGGFITFGGPEGHDDSLSRPDGQEFFWENMEDCALPMLVGTLISATPSKRRQAGPSLNAPP